MTSTSPAASTKTNTTPLTKGAPCGTVAGGSHGADSTLGTCAQGTTCQEVSDPDDSVMRCLPSSLLPKGGACGTVAGGSHGADLIISNCAQGLTCQQLFRRQRPDDAVSAAWRQPRGRPHHRQLRPRAQVPGRVGRYDDVPVKHA
jgi:hypothetical protein